MTERPGLARIHKWPNPYARCDIYTCRRPGKWIIEHREGIFGTDHLVLCQECMEAMLQNLPEELKVLVPVQPHDTAVSDVMSVLKTADGLQLLRALHESMEIQALANGEDVPAEFRIALGGLLDMLADAGAGVEAPPAEAEDKPFECDKCGKRFKTRNALAGHMASHRGGRK